jgi:hypothetical protein
MHAQAYSIKERSHLEWPCMQVACFDPSFLPEGRLRLRVSKSSIQQDNGMKHASKVTLKFSHAVWWWDLKHLSRSSGQVFKHQVHVLWIDTARMARDIAERVCSSGLCKWVFNIESQKVIHSQLLMTVPNSRRCWVRNTPCPTAIFQLESEEAPGSQWSAHRVGDPKILVVNSKPEKPKLGIASWGHRLLDQKYLYQDILPRMSSSPSRPNIHLSSQTLSSFRSTKSHSNLAIHIMRLIK